MSGDRQRLGCGSLTRLSPLGELLACPRALLSRRTSRRVTIGFLATAITPQTTAIPPRRLHGRCADRSWRASGLHDLGNQAWPSSPEPARLATELRFRRRRRLDDPRAATTQRRHGSPPRWSAACGMPAGRSDVVRLLPSSLLARELRSRHVVHGEHEPEVKCINADLSELCEIAILRVRESVSSSSPCTPRWPVGLEFRRTSSERQSHPRSARDVTRGGALYGV